MECVGIVIVHAHAKLNLTLEVLRKRTDGYHEIRSVMRTIELHDSIRVSPANAIEVNCSVESLSGESNLAFRAATLLQQRADASRGARIVIEKRIPVAAGLGGGSSDAAATLCALNTFWGAGYQPEQLERIGAELGSDVPFLVRGGLALARGKGDRLQDLPSMPSCEVVLVNPGFAVSTAAVYAAVDTDAYTDGSLSEQYRALPAGIAPTHWPLFNALQAVTTAKHSEIAAIVEALNRWGAAQAMMCGSGPTCFGLFDDRHVANRAAALATEQGWGAWHTRFC